MINRVYVKQESYGVFLYIEFSDNLNTLSDTTLLNDILKLQIESSDGEATVTGKPSSRKL